MVKTVKIIKKVLGTFFSHFQALTKCKVSEKSNERLLIFGYLFIYFAKSGFRSCNIIQTNPLGLQGHKNHFTPYVFNIGPENWVESNGKSPPPNMLTT